MTGELRAYYLGALPGRMEALESAFGVAVPDADARAAVRRIAHSLKGSGASYGFPQISEAAAAAESAHDDDLAARVADLLAVMRAAVAAGDAPAVRPSEERILIVDDDPDAVHLIRTVLEAPGRVFTVAADVASARSAVAEEQPLLILLDLVLPDGDGRSLLMWLRERPATATTPIVVLTATSGERTRAECLALGADQVLEKPFDPALVTSIVRQQLHRAGRVREATHRDALTGLANRAAFAEAWRELSGRSRRPVRIAVVDLDRFKDVNDSFGHNRGDRVLERVAAVMRETLAHARLVARWGGEEFAVLYEGESARHAEAELRQLVERVEAEAFESDGRSFVLTLSAGLAEADDAPPLEEAIARADYFLYLAKATGRNRLVTTDSSVDAPAQNILLAEDDELTASLITHRLRREGLEVEHRDVGSKALEAARNGNFALVILDVKMPGMDGFDVLRELREMRQYRDTPILMLTSMGSEEDVVRGLNLGATDYVLKPFSPVQLVARVQRHLRRL